MYNDKQIKKYFDLARNASTFSDYPRVKIGAILVYKNKVVSLGYNTTKTHPLQKKYNIYRNANDHRKYNVEKMSNAIHAEMSCLLSARHLDIDWGKVSIFVYRSDLNGNLALCRPCNACYTAIKSMGIKHIYYTTQNGWGYEYID